MGDDSWPVSPQQGGKCFPEEERQLCLLQGALSVGNFKILGSWKPGLVVRTCDPDSPGEWQVDQKFKVIHHYITSSRAARNLIKPSLKNKAKPSYVGQGVLHLEPQASTELGGPRALEASLCYTLNDTLGKREPQTGSPQRWLSG